MALLSTWINKFANRSKRFNPRGDVRTINLLQVVMKERCRAERNSSNLSFVLLRNARQQMGNELLDEALSVVIGEIRFTDEVGFINKKAIGIVLPDTSFEGATCIANKVSNALNEKGANLLHEVYTYPSKWFTIDALLQREAGQKEYHELSEGSEAEKTQQTAHFFREQSIPGWKRFVDIVGSSMGIAIMFPLLLPVAIWIKLVSPGPVFFRQERVGFMGDRFRIWKFRTMHVNPDREGHYQYMQKLIENENTPMKKRERHSDMIFLGSWIRKMSLDEFPQLINVFKGEMSLVGPRPSLPQEVANFQRWHANRFDTLPGMSGMWQISGKNRLSFREMVRLDIQYIRRRSLVLDLFILVVTIPVVLCQAFQRA